MLHVAAPRSLYFGKFSLDLARGCLRAGDQDIELRPKTFEVLKYLATNAGRLVTKQELYDAVWPNVIVTDDSIAQCIRELRGKLADDNHSLIKTVSRRGYLLDTTVTTSALEQLPVATASIARERQQAELAPQVTYSGPIHTPRAWAAMLTLFFSAIWGATFLLGGTSLTSQRQGLGEPLSVFQDCETCPEMVVLPAGDFMMGSPASELGRVDVEGLPRRVVIPKRIAIGKFEVTVEQMSIFMTETGMSIGGSCRRLVNPERSPPTWSAPEVSLEHPGYETRAHIPRSASAGMRPNRMWHGSSGAPAKPIGSRPKRNGNMPHALARPPATVPAMMKAQSAPMHASLTLARNSVGMTLATVNWSPMAPPRLEA